MVVAAVDGGSFQAVGNGPVLADRARTANAFWNLDLAEAVRRALATAASVAQETSPGQTPPPRDSSAQPWHAVGLGPFLAPGFYLGTLRASGTNIVSGAGAAGLQTPDDVRLLAADLTQRFTEAFTRLVQAFYVHFLGRAAALGEESGWVGMLLSGQTEEEVLSAFLSTAEFYQRTGALVQTGTGDECFIQGLYRLLLDRPADSAELTGWLGALPQLGRGGVVSAVLASTEYRTLQIEAYYQDLFQRPATSTEVASWVNSPFDLKTIRILLETHLPAPSAE
jgi:hypothetical protein